MVVADRQVLVQGQDDHRIREQPSHQTQGFDTEAEDVMEMNHVREEVRYEAAEMQGKITAVPVGQPEMVVFVGKEQRLVAGLAQGQQGCAAVAADRRPDAREVVRLTVRTPFRPWNRL